MKKYLFIFKRGNVRILNLILGMVVIASLTCLCGCSAVLKSQEPRILSDLVYKEGKTEEQYTVYIEENGTYVSYLVLTDQYEGEDACLLLRKTALDTPLAFSRNQSYASFYPGSDIDQYLNQEFYGTLSTDLCDILCSSPISVTSKSSLGYCGKDTQIIYRNIFLLSVVEVGGQSSATVPSEGTKLSYFSNRERRVVQTSSGVTTSWWLRTPNTWHDNVVCSVNTEGIIGIGGIGGFGEDYQNGVRPAFCLPAETPIQKQEGFYLKLGG